MTEAGARREGRPRVHVFGPAEAPFWEGLAAVRGEVDLTIGEAANDLAAAEVLFYWVTAPPPEPLWPGLGRLRWLHSASAGVDRFLFPALLQSEVVLTRSTGVYAPALAEYALAALLYFAKRLPQMVAAQQRRAWQSISPALLAGATLGIVGLGDIGLAVARLARPLGLRVLGLRRVVVGGPPEGVDEVLAGADLPALLARSDYVVVTLPLTPQTRGLLGAEQLAHLKPGAVLVNIARGGIVDEAALLAALREGRLAGAACDVFAREPLPADDPLWEAPNLLISAHTVDNVPGWEQRAVAGFVQNLRRYLAGQPLLNVVDKGRGY
ncbi:MAG: D-2-hydroxyacid dehydrogenase [Chloroflexota bacterium]